MHTGCTRVCSKCAHSVQRGCAEHEEPMGRAQMERAAKTAQSVHRVHVECAECPLSLHGLCDRASTGCVFRVCTVCRVCMEQVA